MFCAGSTRDDLADKPGGGRGALAAIHLTQGAKEEILKLTSQGVPSRVTRRISVPSSSRLQFFSRPAVAQSSVSSLNVAEASNVYATDSGDVPVTKKSVVQSMRIRIKQVRALAVWLYRSGRGVAALVLMFKHRFDFILISF
jgi:hypothetical protein